MSIFFFNSSVLAVFFTFYLRTYIHIFILFSFWTVSHSTTTNSTFFNLTCSVWSFPLWISPFRLYQIRSSQFWPTWFEGLQFQISTFMIFSSSTFSSPIFTRAIFSSLTFSSSTFTSYTFSPSFLFFSLGCETTHDCDSGKYCKEGRCVPKLCPTSTFKANSFIQVKRIQQSLYLYNTA